MSASKPVTAFESDKVRALLAYLAIEADRAHSRSSLAALLWPDYREESARVNLRHVLHQLRVTTAASHATGHGAAATNGAVAAPLFLSNRQTVQINPALVTVDVFDFEQRLAACAAHKHSTLHTCDTCLAHLVQASELYRGELLAGFGLADSPMFEEWLLTRREVLQYQFVNVLNLLANAYEEWGDYERAHTYATRHLAIDPYREDSHRQVMRLLAQRNLPHQALAQYVTCRRLLQEEFGAAVDEATTALYNQIRTGTFPTRQPINVHGLANQVASPPGTQPLPALFSPAVQVHSAPGAPDSPPMPTAFQDWGEMHTIEYLQGRTAELAQLERWLVWERCRLVTVLGMGGVGKTTLAAATAKLVAPHFTTVIWRSLLNAPPLADLLHTWLHLLSRRTLTTVPDTLDEQLRLLLNYLRQQRCLLILDNFESILQAGPQTGEMRAGYADYTRLLQQLAAGDHGSCLLLTSREPPLALARWLDATAPVRALTLAGLDAQVGHAILQQHGLAASSTEAAALVRQYSGNPLALQMVAHTVVDFFGGDVAAFQREGVAVFANIRQVLDEQFARLSELEQEIIFWLAIEREPVTVPTLRRNFVQPPSPRLLVEALHALQRRSLLEQGDGFTLQNVVMEYATERLVEGICTELLADWVVGAMGNAVHVADTNIPTPLLLQRHALRKAQGKEYVQQSQVRLIVQPLAERLVAALGKAKLVVQVQQILDSLRTATRQPGYAAGNVLNLLRHLGVDLTGYNFSHLSVWQADLRGANFTAVDFTGADLAQSAFTLAFDLGAVQYGEAGQVLVAGVIGGDICLWRAGAGQLQHAFRAPCNGAYPVVFGVHGQLLANSSLDHTIYVWSVESGARLQRLAGHTDKIYKLAFSADGRQLASSSCDGTVCLWDIEHGQRLHTLYEQADAITALAFRSDGALLAGGGGGQLICLWDTQSGQIVSTLHGHTREVECVAFSPDDQWLASGAHDGNIRLWELASGQCVHTLQAGSQIIRAVAFHPAGHILASGSANRTVRLWDRARGEVLHTLQGHKYEINSLSFSRDGRMLATGGLERMVRLWDTATGETVDFISGHAELVRAVRFSPDGQWLASSAADGILRLWDVHTPGPSRVAKQLQAHTGQIFTIAFHPQGRLVASGSADHVIHIWEIESGKLIHTLRGHTDAVKAIAFHPTRQLLASASADHTIRLWSLAAAAGRDQQEQRILRGHTDVVNTIAFSPDGQSLLSGSLDHTARLWDWERGHLRYLLEGHSCALFSTIFSPDGRYLITNSWDAVVYLWDAHSGQRLTPWPAHQVGALGVAFSPDGQTLACVTGGQSIELRHFASGARLETLQGHRITILSLDFSPTEPILVSSSWDGAIKRWDLRTPGQAVCLETCYTPGPYTGMKIHGVTGISEAQKASLKLLGAIEEG